MKNETKKRLIIILGYLLTIPHYVVFYLSERMNRLRGPYYRLLCKLFRYKERF